MHPYDVRASDLDRERVVEFLKAHYADGRLQAHELAWRTDAAYRAVGLAELDRLTVDLPAFVAPRPRRRPFPLAVAALVLCAVLVVLVATVPLTFLFYAAIFLTGAFFILAPFAVPVLVIAVVVHLIARAARPRPRPRHVGWR